MDDHVESGNIYVAFQVKNSMFAVPMNDTLYIAAGSQNTIYTILPNTPDHIKCIVELGGQLVTVVDIPGTDGDIPIMGNYIVILLHSGWNIGILATEVHLVRTMANSIFTDKITGEKFIDHNGKKYLILDISRLYKELDI